MQSLCGFMCLLFCLREKRLVQFLFVSVRFCFIFRVRPDRPPTLSVAYAGCCLSLSRAVITGTDHSHVLFVRWFRSSLLCSFLLSSVFETESYHITQADLELTILLPQLRTIGVSHHSLLVCSCVGVCSEPLSACLEGKER